MGSLLLVGLSGGVVLGLIDLVGDGIAGGVEAVWREESQYTSQEEDADAEDAGRDAYRVPRPWLLSLATSLLASLEAPLVALWTLSAT